MKWLALYLLSVTFLGCTVQRTINRNYSGSWDRIAESGVSKDAHGHEILQKVVREEDGPHFKTDISQVTWWARFKPRTFLGGIKTTDPFTVNWHDPSGNVFYEDHVSIGLWNVHFVKSTLRVADTPVALFPGEWEVAAYYQGQLMDRKKFHLMDTNSRASAVQAAASQGWTSLDQLGLPRDSTPFFRENFEQVKNHYKNGRYSDAEILLRDILNKEPFHTEAHLALGAVYVQFQRWGDALKEIDYVIQNPNFREQGMNLRQFILEKREEAAVP